MNDNNNHNNRLISSGKQQFSNCSTYDDNNPIEIKKWGSNKSIENSTNCSDKKCHHYERSSLVTKKEFNDNGIETDQSNSMIIGMEIFITSSNVSRKIFINRAA